MDFVGPTKTFLGTLAFAATVIFLSGCESVRLYSGPEGPADQMARIETRQDTDIIGSLGEFRIIAVDEMPWANGNGLTRGTMSPGYRRIKFSYRYTRCRTPTLGEVAGLTGLAAVAVVGNIAFNAPVFDVAACPSDLYGVKGIVPLDAEAGGQYVMIAERSADLIYVHISEKRTGEIVAQKRYYKTTMLLDDN